MKIPAASLFWRISAIFLLLLLLLSLGHLWISVETARDFAQESDQSLNRFLARDLVPTFQPVLREGVPPAQVAELIEKMMVFNPRVEIYLLDAEGTMLDYHPPGRASALAKVRVAPIRTFLAGKNAAPLPIRGDDPRHPGRPTPFSAAEISVGGRAGFLYLILGGEHYQSVAAMVEESYIIRNSLIGLVAMFLLVGIAGLTIFFVLTKRLRAMTRVVRELERGNYSQRVGESSRDEIGQLGRAFDDMADKVVANLEQMRQTDRLRRELVANVSHDLRSPLSSIQGYLETILIKDAALDEPKRRQFLETIHSNVLRLNSLVGELFELSKLDAHQVEPRIEPFSLPELTQDVVMKFHPQAQQQEVTLEQESPRRMPPVYCDIAMIERVFSNLIDNALRSTPKGGKVRIVLEHSGAGVTVEVRDTGSGISAEDLPKVFDRFFRADKSRSRNSGGLGIGLAIAKGILAAHQQPIWVTSEPARGTSFRFTLPTQPPPGAAPAAKP